MIFVKILPCTVGSADRPLVVLRVDQEKGRGWIRRTRRQCQVEPWAAVPHVKDVVGNLGICRRVGQPFRNLQRTGPGFRDIRSVRHVHVDQELVALAERKHLLRHAIKQHDGEHDKDQACGQDDGRKVDGGAVIWKHRAPASTRPALSSSAVTRPLPRSQTVSAGRM